MAKKMTFGLIVGNRGFFPGPPGEERPRGNDRGAERRRVRRGLPQRGTDQVRRRGNARRGQAVRGTVPRRRDEIDGVIVTLPNFGEERAIADTLRLADLNVPVLVQATPDTAGKMTIADRRDSFCGKMSACNNLKQYGIPYSLTTLHTEAPDSARVQEGPRLVRRRLPRRERPAQAAHRRHRRAPGRVQHGPLQREAAGSERHRRRDHRPVRDLRPHREDEGRRPRRAGEAEGDPVLCQHRGCAPARAAQDGQARARSSTAGCRPTTWTPAPCSAGPRWKSTSAWCPARS